MRKLILGFYILVVCPILLVWGWERMEASMEYHRTYSGLYRQYYVTQAAMGFFAFCALLVVILLFIGMWATNPR